MLETPFWIFCTGVIDSTGALPVYDVLEIKKKRASPVRNNPYPVKPHFLYDKHHTQQSCYPFVQLFHSFFSFAFNVKKIRCTWLPVSNVQRISFQMDWLSWIDRKMYWIDHIFSLRLYFMLYKTATCKYTQLFSNIWIGKYRYL